jgi:RNA polymerase sigma-70 factor (ECF subfamily)
MEMDGVDSGALRRQDAAAFEALYRAVSPSLAAYLRRLCRQPDLVEDLLQETFQRAYDALPRTEVGTQFRPWLFVIATNVARSAARTAYWRRVAAVGDWELDRRPSGEASPEERAEAADLIGRALAALKPDDAALLLLRQHAGFTVDELGAANGLAREAVKKRLYRARKAFSAAYARELLAAQGSHREGGT